MRIVRWLSIGILLLSVIYFAGYNWKVLQTKDEAGPVITMEEEHIYISVKDGEEALLEGVTAQDAKDGDVTDSLLVESLSGFVDENVRYINYTAFDSNNHVTKESRKMSYTDYEPIRFSLEEPLRFPESSSKILDILGYVCAEDCLDGDISDRIRFSPDSNISMDVAGEYYVKLEVTNSAGAVGELPVVVTIYNTVQENAAPRIQLSEYLVYTKVGKKLDAQDYLESVTWRGTEYALTTSRGTFGVDASEMEAEELRVFRTEQENSPSVAYERFTILDQTDYQTPGVYEIEYSLEDDEENIGSVRLIVVVEEE